MIVTINYDDIYQVWKNYLWPDRKSDITETSAMTFLGGYDIVNMSYTPTFFGYIENNKLLGVNSGHMCVNNSYRSRGLFVFSDARQRGIGSKLLIATIEQGCKESATFVWSYPKQTSWKTYEKAGFGLSSPWEPSELGMNAYCAKYF
jgi:GNAT superfamily N-acetyltransferase